MSFSADVKNELLKNYPKQAHCRAAEAAGMLMLSTSGELNKNKIAFEDENIAEKCLAQISKSFGVNAKIKKEDKRSFIIIENEEDIIKIQELATPDKLKQHEKLLEKNCCKRAFLKGAFLIGGAASDPEKSYHLEIANANRDVCEFLQALMSGFEIKAKISKRRDKYFTYIKEADEVSDMLNVIEAHIALMNFENVRILRGMRGNINRKVNCDAANIEKTIKASMKQIEDIDYIKEAVGLDILEEGLLEIANLRLQHPDVPLSQLGEMADPPIGKSGANHRMRKINRIAGQIKEMRNNGK